MTRVLLAAVLVVGVVGMPAAADASCGMPGPVTGTFTGRVVDRHGTRWTLEATNATGTISVHGRHVEVDMHPGAGRFSPIRAYKVTVYRTHDDRLVVGTNECWGSRPKGVTFPTGLRAIVATITVYPLWYAMLVAIPVIALVARARRDRRGAARTVDLDGPPADPLHPH